MDSFTIADWIKVDGKDHHYAMTYDSNKNKVIRYLDGEEIVNNGL